MDTPADGDARTGRTSSFEYASHYFAGHPVSSEALFGQRHNFVVKIPPVAVIYRYKPFPAILRVFFFTDNSRTDERGNGSGYRWSRHFKGFADFCITRRAFPGRRTKSDVLENAYLIQCRITGNILRHQP